MTEISGTSTSSLVTTPTPLLAWRIKMAGNVVLAILCLSSLFFWLGHAPHDSLIRLAYPNILSACAISGSALWASWFALQAIENQRQGATKAAEATTNAVSLQQNNARKNLMLQETLELILRSELDAEFIAAKSAWSSRNRAQTNNGGSEKTIPELMAKKHYGATLSTAEMRDAILIGMFFNHFEVIALAISQNIIDEEFYKRWQKSLLINSWNAAAETIGVIRGLQSNPKLYIEWQNLAEAWGKTEPVTHITRPPEKKTAELVQLAGGLANTNKAVPAPAHANGDAQGPKQGPKTPDPEA